MVGDAKKVRSPYQNSAPLDTSHEIIWADRQLRLNIKYDGGRGEDRRGTRLCFRARSRKVVQNFDQRPSFFPDVVYFSYSLMGWVEYNEWYEMDGIGCAEHTFTHDR